MKSPGIMHLIMPSTKQRKNILKIYEILKWSTDSISKAND